jgi:nitroreductase
VLERVLEAARIAPWGDAGSGGPPTRLIVVRDPAIKKQLVPMCHNQAFIASAPAVVVACGRDIKWNRGGWMGRYAMIVDVTIAVDHMMLAARAEGLGTCWIGSFDNAALKQFFELPDEMDVVAVMPVGYPDGDLLVEPSDKRRPPLQELVRWDSWK